MIVILALAVGLVIVVGLGFLFARGSHRRNDTISGHQRALAALRAAEQRHPSTWVETAPASSLTDHVHILDAPPVKPVVTRRRRRPARRPAPGRRRTAADIAARPTIAQLPTAGSIPSVWLPSRAESLAESAEAAIAIEADGA